MASVLFLGRFYVWLSVQIFQIGAIVAGANVMDLKVSSNTITATFVAENMANFSFQRSPNRMSESLHLIPMLVA